ncbi:apolipoprotein N-acyltransferase [bacterium]|nr:apolipoprotein N-acyltransferase [bacterium]
MVIEPGMLSDKSFAESGFAAWRSLRASSIHLLASTLVRATLPSITSILLLLSFAPFSYCFFAWVSYLPLLTYLTQPSSQKRSWLPVYIAGVLFYAWSNYPIAAASMSWMSPYWLGWIVLSGVCGLKFIAIGSLIIRFQRLRGHCLAIATPISVVSVEYVSGEVLDILIGVTFPWTNIAMTQIDTPFIPQVADIGGISLVAFLVLMANGLLADALLRALFPRKSERKQIVGVACAACCLSAACVYGAMSTATSNSHVNVSIAIINGQLTLEGDLMARNELAARTAASVAKDRRIKGQFDLCVWPEACWIGPPIEINPPPISSDFPLWHRTLDRSLVLKGESVLEIEAMASSLGGTLLLGATRVDSQTGCLFNSAIAVNGWNGVIGVYDKTRLAPFLEDVSRPIVRVLSEVFFSEFMGRRSRYRPGSRSLGAACESEVPTDGTRVIPFICFDLCDSSLWRQRVFSCRNRPTILVHLANEGLDRSGTLKLLFRDLCRYRAIECRRAIVRSVSGGLSGLIDANGGMCNAFDTSSGRVHVAHHSDVPARIGATLFIRLGDWVQRLSLIYTSFVVCYGYVQVWRGMRVGLT